MRKDTPEESEIIIEDTALAGGFVQVPAVVMFDTELTAGAKVTYGALLWYAWKLGKFPGQKVLAGEIGGGESTIRRHLAELQKAGYIVAEQLGLGRPNRYIIKSLQKRPLPDRSKMSGLGAQKRAVKPPKNERSLVLDDSDSTTQTLSHTSESALTDLLFEALGERKPAGKKRERAARIINDLLTEGFSEAAIKQAIRLAGERGARGPDLLPYVIGEAHELAEGHATEERQEQQFRDMAEAERQTREKAYQDRLAAVEALAPKERERLEREVRASLKVRVSEDMLSKLIPGMIATRLAGASLPDGKP